MFVWIEIFCFLKGCRLLLLEQHAVKKENNTRVAPCFTGLSTA
jgi:hypothetical protein